MMFSCKPASQYNVLYTLGYCATGEYLCWLCTRASRSLHTFIHSLHSTYMDRAYETSLQFCPLKKSSIVYRLVVFSGSWFKLLGSNSYLCWPSRSAVCIHTFTEGTWTVHLKIYWTIPLRYLTLSLFTILKKLSSWQNLHLVPWHFQDYCFRDL